MTTAATHYGCHNRATFKPMMEAQNGWWLHQGQRFPAMVGVPFRMATDCQYTRDPMGLGQKDPRCEGCRWRADAGQEVKQ